MVKDNAVKFYFVYDGHGNVWKLIDENGPTRASYVYDA